MGFISRIYYLYFSKDKNFVRRLSRVTGFVPSKIKIYKMAFSHKSATDNSSGFKQNNERLEYLGDAVLSTVVAEYLFKKYPNGNEGFLTKMRSKIVKRKCLNGLADQMGLDVILADFNKTKISQSMLGNALEALIGAVYLELGFSKTKTFIIESILRQYLDFSILEDQDDNYKSQLLEWGQKEGKEVDFRMLEKYRFEKRDRFKVGVFIDGTEITTAEDFNKKSAEQTASNLAMDKLGLKA